MKVKHTRNRKPVLVTLSDEARRTIDALADVWGLSRSAAVERLIVANGRARHGLGLVPIEASKAATTARSPSPKKGGASAP